MVSSCVPLRNAPTSSSKTRAQSVSSRIQQRQVFSKSPAVVPCKVVSSASLRNVSMASKGVAKTSMRRIPTLSAGVKSPAMWKCSYCPKSFTTKMGLSVHRERWCERNPTGKGFVPMASDSLAPAPASQVPTASQRALSGQGDRKLPFPETPAVPRQSDIEHPRSASSVVRPGVALVSRRGLKASSKKVSLVLSANDSKRPAKSASLLAGQSGKIVVSRSVSRLSRQADRQVGIRRGELS